MNEKGWRVLKRFLSHFGPRHIAYVVVAKDDHLQHDCHPELVQLCKQYGVTCFDRKEKLPPFDGYKFAIGWRWMIRDADKLIVLHDSPLPRYRGFAPLVNMLINGERQLGVTALLASEEYDRGDILLQQTVAIDYPIKIKEAINRIAPLYENLVIDVSSRIFAGEPLSATPQDESKATYSLWRDELDYVIDWHEEAAVIQRKVDALGNPYAGARTTLNNQPVILDEVVEMPDVTIENRNPGKVIFMESGCPVVVCGKGLIKIIQASYSDGTSIIPLRQFRSRFGH